MMMTIVAMMMLMMMTLMMMMMVLAGSPVCGDYSVPTFAALNLKSHLYCVNNPVLAKDGDDDDYD